MSTKLLIISNLDANSIFRRGSLNRALAIGLQTAGIDWTLCHPLATPPSLSNFDAALTWCHHLAGDIGALRQGATQIEDDCRREGVPVVHSIRKLRRIRHSFCLRRWLDYGIPCALSQTFTDFDEISLRYPMILRVDGGVHSSLDSFLVRDADEARRLVRERERSIRGPLNLAIEYWETRFPDGYYRKRRCIVVGDRLIPRQHMLSRDWKVKLSIAEANQLSISENRAFMREGESQATLVSRAARALGCDIMALDYSPTPEGGCVFWEANRTFRMAGCGGGVKAAKFRETTGRSVEECFEQRSEVGAAIGELILRKAALRSHQAAPLV